MPGSGKKSPYSYVSDIKEKWRTIINTIRTDYMEDILAIAEIIPFALTAQDDCMLWICH